jgi:hypothetical protein
MKNKLDAYNSKLFVEVKIIRESIKSEIKNKSWNVSVSPTIYNSKSIEYPNTDKSSFKRS